MAQAKFIRIDDEHNSTVRHFDNSAPYEGLKPNEVIDVDCEDGVTREYYVESMQWDFSHFGDTLIITIRPCNPPIKLEHVKDQSGKLIGAIIKS